MICKRRADERFKDLADDRKKTNRTVVLWIRPFPRIFKDWNDGSNFPRRGKTGFGNTFLEQFGKNRRQLR